MKIIKIFEHIKKEKYYVVATGEDKINFCKELSYKNGNIGGLKEKGWIKNKKRIKIDG